MAVGTPVEQTRLNGRAALVSTGVHDLPPQVKLLALVGFVCCVVATPPAAVWPFLAQFAVLAVVIGLARLSPSRLVRGLAIEVPFIGFALAMPFIATGVTVPVAGLQLSVDGYPRAFIYRVPTDRPLRIEDDKPTRSLSRVDTANVLECKETASLACIARATGVAGRLDNVGIAPLAFYQQPFVAFAFGDIRTHRTKAEFVVVYVFQCEDVVNHPQLFPCFEMPKANFDYTGTFFNTSGKNSFIMND